MALDLYGCPLSTENRDVVALVNQFSTELLRCGQHLNCIVEGTIRYPSEAILHIDAAFYYLLSHTGANHRLAAQHLDVAARLIDRAQPREKSLFSIAWHWLHHLLAEAVKNVERHCFKWPKDLTVIKLAEYLFFAKGFTYENKRFLRLTTQCYRDHQNDPDFLPIHAHALALNKRYGESMVELDKVLQRDETNPWSHPLLAYLYHKKGLIDEGIQTLEQNAKNWNRLSPFIASHNHWQLGLLYLENLDFEAAESIYEKAAWAAANSSIAEKCDAASLLWHFDLEGHEHPQLWRQLANAIGDEANFASIPYYSILLCYALKKGGRIDACLSALPYIHAHAHEQIKEDRYVWRDISVPIIQGTLAFAEGDYQLALHNFDAIIKHVACVGGSDTQTDLFYQTYLKSLIATGRQGEAEAHLHQMTQGRTLTKRERKWLAECHATQLKRAV